MGIRCPRGHQNRSVLLPPSALPHTEQPASRRAPPQRGAFKRFAPIAARWNDVDAFGHVNNAVFYAYFDTAVVRCLHEIGALGVRNGAQVAVVAASGASFFTEVLFTDRIEVGLRVDRLGTSSVTYGIGVFRNDEPRAAVAGHFTHVFVDGADEVQDRHLVGEDPDDVGAALDLGVRALDRVGRADLRPVRGGEALVGEHVHLGLVHSLAELRQLVADLVGHPAPLAVRRLRRDTLDVGLPRMTAVSAFSAALRGSRKPREVAALAELRNARAAIVQARVSLISPKAAPVIAPTSISIRSRIISRKTSASRPSRPGSASTSWRRSMASVIGGLLEVRVGEATPIQEKPDDRPRGRATRQLETSDYRDVG
jgi:acyl-CoA thioester hydrolase